MWWQTGCFMTRAGRPVKQDVTTVGCALTWLPLLAFSTLSLMICKWWADFVSLRQATVRKAVPSYPRRIASSRTTCPRRHEHQHHSQCLPLQQSVHHPPMASRTCLTRSQVGSLLSAIKVPRWLCCLLTPASLVALAESLQSQLPVLQFASLLPQKWLLLQQKMPRLWLSLFDKRLLLAKPKWKVRAPHGRTSQYTHSSWASRFARGIESGKQTILSAMEGSIVLRKSTCYFFLLFADREAGSSYW